MNRLDLNYPPTSRGRDSNLSLWSVGRRKDLKNPPTAVGGICALSQVMEGGNLVLCRAVNCAAAAEAPGDSGEEEQEQSNTDGILNSS
jgi:hypothetical protein